MNKEGKMKRKIFLKKISLVGLVLLCFELLTIIPAIVRSQAEAYSIFGTLSDSNGGGIKNVTVSFSGVRPSVASSSTGGYRQDGFYFGTNYTVTPNPSIWTFTPSYSTVIINGGDRIVNFTGRDLVAPTGSMVCNDAEYANTQSVRLNLSAADSASGMGAGAQMEFSNDNSTWSSPVGYGTSTIWPLSTGDGSKAVYAKFKDVANNWSNVYSDTIILDLTPPTGSIRVNNNATYTNSTSVTLNLTATDSRSGMGTGAQMRFSNNNLTWFPGVAYNTIQPWTLASLDGNKTVSVQFKDVAGKNKSDIWSSVYSDMIILDTIPPIMSAITALSETINKTALTASWAAATDATSGIKEYQYKITKDSTTGSLIKDWANTTSISVTATGLSLAINSTYYFSVRAIDKSGNFSTVSSSKGTLVLDSNALTISGTIKQAGTTFPISGVKVYFGSGLLNATETDSSGTYTKIGFSSGSTVMITPIKPGHTITPKEIMINSSTICDFNGTDTVAPIGNILINQGDKITRSSQVTLYLLATDTNGVSQMKVSNNNTDWLNVTTEAYKETKLLWPLDTAAGNKTVYVKFKDNASNSTNWSGAYSDTITYSP